MIINGYRIVVECDGTYSVRDGLEKVATGLSKRKAIRAAKLSPSKTL